jgi:hypothetical protein
MTLFGQQLGIEWFLEVMGPVFGTLLSLFLAASASGASHLFPDCESGLLSNNTVCDTSASVADRAKALVAALTTEEKFQLVVSTSPGVERLGLPAYEWWRMSCPSLPCYPWSSTRL